MSNIISVPAAQSNVNNNFAQAGGGKENALDFTQGEWSIDGVAVTASASQLNSGGGGGVASVNTLTGVVTVDGTNIDGTYTPLNYTIPGSTLDNYFEGLDVALGSISSPWSLAPATINNNYAVVGKPTVILVNNTDAVYNIILPDLTVNGSYVNGMNFQVVNIGTQACNVVNYLVDLVVPVQAGTTMQFNVLDDSTQDGTFSFTPTNNYGTILSGGGTYNLTYPLSEVYWVQDVGSVVFPDATDPNANGSPKSILIFSPNVSEVLVYNNASGFLGAIPYYSGYQFTNFSNATAAGDWRSVEIALSIPVLGKIFAQQYSVMLTADAEIGFGGFGAADPFVWKDPTVLTDITLTIDNAGTTYPGFPISVHNFKGNTGAIIVTLTGPGSPTFDNDGVTTTLTLNPGDGVKLTSVNSGGVTGPSVDYIYRASIPNKIRWVVQGGSDTTDSGTVDKPYATIEYALTQITDASPTNVYELVVVGYFTGVTLTLKPCITYDFTGAFLDYSGYMELDASVDATPNARLDILGGKQRWPGSINLVLPGTNQVTVMFYDGDFKDTQSVNVLQDSGSSNQCVVGFVNCLALPDGSVNPPVAGPNFYVENATLIHLGSSAASIEVINNSSAAGNRAVVHGCLNPTCGYTFSSIDSPPLNVDMEASPITGILNLDGNTVALAIDTASYADAVSYTNGATLSQITFKNEAGGLEAGFVPTNYTVISSQVKQHLQGIDVALGSITNPITVSSYTGATLGAFVTPLAFDATVLTTGGKTFVSLYLPSTIETTVAGTNIFFNPPLSAPLIPSVTRNVDCMLMVNNVPTPGLAIIASGSGTVTLALDGAGTGFPNSTPNCGFPDVELSYQI